MHRNLAAASFAIIVAAPVWAGPAEVDVLWGAMRFDDYADVLVAEGKAYGDDLADSLFGAMPSGGWGRAVAAIYDLETLRSRLSEELHVRLDEHDMDEAVAFFQGTTGARSIELEISARWALLDPDIEAASVDALYAMEADGDPRLDLVQAFSDANGLVDNNVVSAMNGNYAFLSALADAGQGPFADDRQGILSAVWEQEPEIRAETEEWVLSFFSFAYGPLSDAEVQELIDFSETDQGKRLNEALFGAFDVLFNELSARLGTAAALYMGSDPL